MSIDNHCKEGLAVTALPESAQEIKSGQETAAGLLSRLSGYYELSYVCEESLL